MSVLSDLRDFIYLELPQRPVIIKGNEAVGDPNISTIAKVNFSPIGTFYLRDEVSPKTILYKSGTESIDLLELNKGGGINDTTTIIVDSTSIEIDNETLTALQLRIDSVETSIEIINNALHKNNLTATNAPSNTDDISVEYTIGSVLIDVVARKSYICVDSTINNAILNSSNGDTSSVTGQDATVNIRLSDLEDIILSETVTFVIPSKRVNNRYMHFVQNIPSNILGCKYDNARKITKIKASYNNLSDSTIIIKLGDVIIKEIILLSIENNYTEVVDIDILADTNINILVKSNMGVDYPVVRLDII